MPPRRRQTRPAETGPVHLTKEGLERMKARLAALKASIPALAAEAERTAAFGDRSDNAEYKEAKSTLRRAHSQIWSIEDRLKRVVVIADGPNAAGTIQIGSVVTVERVEGDGGAGASRGGTADGSTAARLKTYRILGSMETNPAQGRISFESPLGAALIGHKQGDVVKVTAGNGVSP